MEVTEKKAAQVNEQAERSDSSFDRKRHIFGAIFGPLCALLVYFTQIEGLSPESHKLLAIMTLVAIWWITEPVAIPVTSIIGPTLCVVFGVVKMKEAFAAFANPMIFLFMGGFIIAKAMMVNGLDKRIAYGIMSMKWVGDSPRRIFLAIGLACMIWMDKQHCHSSYDVPDSPRIARGYPRDDGSQWQAYQSVEL